MIIWFYFLIFILSLCIFANLLVYNKKCDSLLILFALMVVINCAGYYFLSTSKSLEMALFSNKMLYVGGCFAPLFTVLLLCRLCKLNMPKILTIFLFLYSSMILALTFTVEKHQVYYQYVELINTNGYSYLEKIYGPAHILYPIMVIIYGLLMLYFIFYSIKKRAEVSTRVILTIGGAGVTILSMYLLEKITNSNIALAPLGYLISTTLIAKYYTRINMYDLSSNLSAALEKMNDYGYLIFDKQYRFFNANSMVKELFDEINNWKVDEVVPPTDSYLYQSVIQYLMNWTQDDVAGKTINVKDRYFRLHIRPISYGRKKQVGFLLELTDCTMEQQYFTAMEEYHISMEKEIKEKTHELLLQQKHINKLFLQTVTALSEAVDAKDRYTSGHSKRVAEYAKKIAARMGKSKEEQDEIYSAGLLHDVGKIRIPVEIINKPGKLTDEEYNIIKIHPVTGYHILRGISGNSFIAIGSKYHHERFDGKGYPNGLTGEKIPEIARILGIADSYDAMTSNRSYRNALPQAIVRSEIEKGKGTQFDPAIADIMLQLIDEDTEYTMKQADSLHRRILTVDDEPMNHKIIAHIMRDEPLYEIQSASSGREALALLENQCFDLILLDVKMPEMDGLEVLMKIRENYQVPVVLMTGDKTLDTSTEFAKLGCDDYITKPFLPILIKEVVHNMTKQLIR